MPASAPTPPHFHTSFAAWLVRLAIAFALMLVIFASAGCAGVAAFELIYRGYIYPGVRAWGMDLSGMTPEQAALALSAVFTYPQSAAVTFRAGDRVWTTTPAELGVNFDLPATVAAAYAVGRTGNLWADLNAQFDAWYFGTQVSPIVRYDEAGTLLYLHNVAQQVFVPTVEASLVAEGLSVKTTPGQIGRQLDVLAGVADLRDPIFSLSPADVSLKFIETPPLVLDASPQAAAAEAILREHVTLTIADAAEGDPGPWTIDQPTLGTLLKIRRVEDGPNAAHFEVGLDLAGLRAILEPIAPLVERRQPVNARFIFNDTTHQLELLERSRGERHLDVDATIARINEHLAQGVHTVPVVFKSVAPAAGDDATAQQLGITQLVSEQSTLFAGSSAERISNIKIAAARFHGLLVPPNAEFSFNANLGDVSLDTGYAEAWIIIGGRTIRGVGGGVCQVSTTVFRAAYFGGYPIVERHSHAYRVGYYERGESWKGPGLDATVYAPLVDFKFKNDTPYWLLMETYVDEKNFKLTWKFYSTSDGRQVSVSPPTIENVVPAPETLYEFDPTLPPGEKKQVDFAADGADVTVTRTITRDGVVTNPSEKPLFTHYQPWRAIWHYGPGAEGIPTPTP